MLEGLRTHLAGAKPSRFRIDPERTPPRRVTRAGVETVEAIFRFETVDGRGAGVVRFSGEDGGTLRAWTLLTALEELRGHEERIGRRRASGDAYARDFRGPNWLDLRKTSAAYEDREPAVLVVGGGQAGLFCLALGIGSKARPRSGVGVKPRQEGFERDRAHATARIVIAACLVLGLMALCLFLPPTASTGAQSRASTTMEPPGA